MFVSRPGWQPTFQALTHSDPGSATMRDTMGFDSSSFVSCLAHVTNSLARTASSVRHLLIIVFMDSWKLRVKLIAPHCNYQDIPFLTEYSCDKHHVCAFNRPPQIQLYGKDFSRRRTIYLQHVAKFSHTACAPICAFLSLPGNLETDDSISFCFNKRTTDFGMIWDFVTKFQGPAILS